MKDKTETPATNTEEEYEKVKKLLQKKQNGIYNVSYVLKQIHEKDTLRKTFLAVISNDPARISEVSEKALLSKPTCYSQLHKLLELNLVDRIFVLPIINGTVKNDLIKQKFEEWTRNMPDNLKRYYLAKTSYWVVTNYGKQFAVKSHEFEQEFKIKEIGVKKDG